MAIKMQCKSIKAFIKNVWNHTASKIGKGLWKQSFNKLDLSSMGTWFGIPETHINKMPAVVEFKSVT